MSRLNPACSKDTRLCLAPMFVRLSVQTQAQPLLDLVDYMKRQWIENPVFTPQDWSVYKQPIRTNNDMEGWHNALNRRAGGQCNLPLYYLIELLDREAKLTALTIRLVSERKLKRMQRKTYRHLQAKLFEYWEQYDNRQKTASPQGLLTSKRPSTLKVVT